MVVLGLFVTWERNMLFRASFLARHALYQHFVYPANIHRCRINTKAFNIHYYYKFQCESTPLTQPNLSNIKQSPHITLGCAAESPRFYGPLRVSTASPCRLFPFFRNGCPWAGCCGRIWDSATCVGSADCTILA